MRSFTQLTFAAKATLIFSLLAAGITASEYLNYRRQKALVYQDRGKEVAAITHLKATQIGVWLTERINDGKSQRDRPVWDEIRTLVGPGRGTQQAQKHGLDWLKSFSVMGYAETALLDARGKVRLASMPDTHSVGPAAEALARQAIATCEVVASDLYYTAANHIGLDIFVPLGGGAGTAPVALLLLRVDPAGLLFPLIQRWPAASNTAETLLVPRDGTDVVFLTDLMHRNRAAVARRLPLAKTVLARVGTSERSEAAQAKDYRDVPVLAAARNVPGSSWILISKIDLEEINAPLRQIAFKNALIVLLLLAASGAGAAVLWQQQRQVDAQLLQAGAYNRTLIEASLDPLVTIDAAGKVTDANTATEQITGRTRQELIGSDFSDYFTDPQKARAGYMQVFREGAVQDFALEIRHRGGRHTPVLYSASVYRNVAGQIAGVFAAARDITELKRAEKALKTIQEQLRVATAAGSVGLWYWDIPKDELFFSDECKSLFGLQGVQDLTYGSFERTLYREDVEPTNAKVRAAIETQTEYYAEYRILWPDASMHWIAARGRASYGEDGTPQSLTGAAQDITDRKHAEERLRQQAALLDLAHDAIMVQEPRGRLLFWNRGAEAIYGWSAAEAIGCVVPELLRTSFPQSLEAIMADLTQRGTWEGELQHTTRDGRPLIVASRWSVEHDETGAIRTILEINRDITARKQAEQALTRAGAYNRSLIEANLDPLVTIAPDGKITDVNRATENATGFSRSELIGADFCDYFTDPTRARAGYQQVFREGQVKDYELAIQHRDGRIIPVLYNASTYMDEEGKVAGVFAAARDITERRRAEEKLRQQAALLDLAHDAILVQEPRGTVVFWSRGAEAMYGWSAAEAIGSIATELLRTSSPQSLDAIMADLNQRGTWEGELQHTTRDGQRITVASRWSVEHDDTGAIRTILEINRDITARKQAEQALARAGAYNRSLIEASLDPLVTIAPDGKITDVNRATEQATGYSRTELIGADFCDYFTDPPRARAGYQQVFRDGEVKDYELAMQHRDGHITPVFYNASVYRDERGQAAGVFAAARDISERKRAEEALASKAAELARSNSDLEQFAYVASHDLQEPLRMVANYTGMLAERYQDKLDNDARDFIAYAVDGATRMQTLIDDLLSFSRVGTRGRPFQAIDSTDVLQRALRNLQLAISDSGASVTHGTLPAVMGDPSQLVQVFQNLIGNAIKFRSAAPPRISISAKRDGKRWLFSVRDNGIGIEPEYAERIFAIFQRLHSREEYPGTGIGLAVCRRIVERHGGRIWVESQPGSGCTFSFTVPDAPAAPAPASRQQDSQPAPTAIERKSA